MKSKKMFWINHLRQNTKKGLLELKKDLLSKESWNETDKTILDSINEILNKNNKSINLKSGEKK